MAKQSFTVGQVLTAAQLTSLQQTAMLGGAASAKTASYTLVAADAGTTISMTSTSATTVTVNTGLFAAGDTVFIQNLGSGNLTITAGTATVATAGSLILPQNDAGILYFVSTSSSVFYDFIQVGAASPLTTKGDLYTFGTSDTRLGVGANGTTLVADSAEATGLKWATAGGANVGSATASVDAAQTTTSSSAGDLATAGPAVTLTTGTSALVIVNAKLGNDTDNRGAIMFFEVSGSTTIAVAEERSLLFENGTANSFYPRASAAYRVTLTAGSNTFTAKYARIAGGTAYFATRVITVIDLGS
jgi:hypothetical protein